MGMKEDIQTFVKDGLLTLGNLQSTVTYYASGTPSYNATTGAVTVSQTAYSILATLVRYRKEEIDGDAIRVEDKKALIAALNLPVTPTLNDTLVDGANTWIVVGANIDPAGALWILQLRRP